MTLTIGSMFSGMGGLDLAVAQVLDAEPAWFCEWDDAPSKVLAHHWPTVPNYRDVTQIEWESVPRVDILTGGYPCQPFSHAGRREGTDDDRHLWPHVRKAIRILRPRLAILENVAGHRSLGFDRVLGDLAEDGADVWWASIRASDVGAPHHRERLFILVVPADPGRIGLEAGRPPSRSEAEVAGDHDRERPLPNTASGRGISINDSSWRTPAYGEGDGWPDGSYRSEVTPHPSGIGCEWAGTPRAGRAGPADGHNRTVEWGDYAPAVRRWERVTRPAPAPTEPNAKGKPRLNAAFAEWMMGLPEGHVTGVPGLSRADQLKMIGNGVCPQQGEMALRELLEMVNI